MTEAPNQFQTLMSRLREDPALANLLRPDSAVLVWDGAGERLLWASPEAADFGAGLLDDSGRLDAGSRARRRLEALASGLAPNQGVRLERLLLDPARLSPPVTCACRLAELAGGQTVLVTAIIGAVPKARKVSRPREASVEPIEVVKPVVLPTGGSVRFVWQADPQTRFIHVSTGLSEAVGPMAADILGQSWEEVSRTVAEDPKGEIADLFARQQTWSGRRIAWSVDNKSGKIPVEWAGMPIFGTDRELVGFRGFGLIRRDALRDLEDVRPATPEASEPVIGGDEMLLAGLGEFAAAKLTELRIGEVDEPAEANAFEADVVEPIVEAATLDIAGTPESDVMAGDEPEPLSRG